MSPLLAWIIFGFSIALGVGVILWSLRHSKNMLARRGVITRLNKSLSGTLLQDDVLKTVFYELQAAFGPKKIIVMWRDEIHNQFQIIATHGVKNLNVSLDADSDFVKELKVSQQLLSRDVLEAKLHRTTDVKEKKRVESMLSMLNWLNVEVAMGLTADKDIKGIIFLGKSGKSQTYRKKDYSLMSAINPILAVSLSNMVLYQEALEKGNELKNKIQQTTSELERANTQLQGLDTAKNEFLSIASHQLYTPTTALRGYASMLLEGDFGHLSTEQENVIERIDQSASRLIKLIKTLLDVSRIESGRIDLELEPIGLGEIAEDLVQELHPNAQSKGLVLEFHQPKQDIPRVVVDQQRIRQVMLNFIDNAIKYTLEGRIDVAVYKKGDAVIFAVADTGKGIEPQHMKWIFNKFMRVGGASHFNTEGTGLGLYVAKQIIQEHRGEVFVDSPGEGKGTTFAMSIPTEGSAKSLKVGEKATVVIKAAEAQGIREKAR